MTENCQNHGVFMMVFTWKYTISYFEWLRTLLHHSITEISHTKHIQGMRFALSPVLRTRACLDTWLPPWPWRSGMPVMPDFMSSQPPKGGGN